MPNSQHPDGAADGRGRASRDAHRLSPWEERLHDDDLRSGEWFTPLVAQAVVNARLYAEAENRTRMVRDATRGYGGRDHPAWTGNSTLVGWNKGAERLFGYTAEEVLGTYPPSCRSMIPVRRGPLGARARQGREFPADREPQRHKDGAGSIRRFALPWRERGEIVGAIGYPAGPYARKELERETGARVTDGERRERDAALSRRWRRRATPWQTALPALQMLVDLAAEWADTASVVTFDEGRTGLGRLCVPRRLRRTNRSHTGHVFSRPSPRRIQFRGDVVRCYGAGDRGPATQNSRRICWRRRHGSVWSPSRFICDKR